MLSLKTITASGKRYCWRSSLSPHHQPLLLHLPRERQPASSSARGCIADLSSPASPFPWLKLPGHVPSVTRHQNSILMTLTRRSRPPLASRLCDCAVSAGDTGPRLRSVLSQPLAGPRTMRNNLIPQVFLLC